MANLPWNYFYLFIFMCLFIISTKLYTSKPSLEKVVQENIKDYIKNNNWKW